MLVRRAIEPGYGKWVFPGGYVDRGEQVHVAAVREAKEEAGLDVRLDRLINVYSYPGRAPVIIVFAASILGGELCCDDEGLEAGGFTPTKSRGTSWRFPARRKRCGSSWARQRDFRGTGSTRCNRLRFGRLRCGELHRFRC